MIIKIFSTVTVVLIVWLTIQTADSRQRLASLEQSIESTNSVLRGQGDSVIAQIDQHQESILEQGVGFGSKLDEYISLQKENKQLGEQAKGQLDSAKKSLAAKTGQLEATRSLALVKDSYTMALESELLFKSGNGKEAAEKLLATKKLIWKASDKFPSSKDALRKLMGPIDVVSSSWKQKKAKDGIVKIKNVLTEIIKKHHSS